MGEDSYRGESPGEEAQEARQDRAVDDKLCLIVVAGDDVSYSPQRRGLDLGGLVHEQLNQSSAHACFMQDALRSGKQCLESKFAG